MKLRSNLDQVKRRLRIYQAGLPEAVAAAIAPSYWVKRLEHVAHLTLQAQLMQIRAVQTRAQYESLMARLLKSITGETFAPLGSRYALGMELLAQGQLETALDITAAADFNQKQRTPTGRKAMYAVQEPAALRNLDATRQAIRDWVTLEKRRTEQDAGLTDEEIATRIEEILGVHERAVPKERTPEMDEAAKGLVDAIQQWLAGDGESPPANPHRHLGGAPAGSSAVSLEVVASWLGAVLAAWRAYVAAHLRDRLELQLTKLRMKMDRQLI